MTAPTPEQLAVLVDRAARRLQPDEGELLRAGFAALVAARRSAGGLQAANQRLRAELAALGASSPDAPAPPPAA